ncbi:TAXI family TRAP transporter solute-binding subunit [Thermoanaerobacterium sp. DL9XJH110]|uniref:TAXI family TRAP transporter solute-binding subunit n=1 Tax=Thermoanaerobacterium sp. DL9XJH110 TaxID=3386643 RepID=UPI003BB69862
MRKRWSVLVLLIAALLIMTMVTACGSNSQNDKNNTGSKINETQNNENQNSNRKPIRVTFAGSSPGGVWYMVMSGVAETINRSFPGSAITVVPGDGVANVTRVAQNQAQIGLTHSAIAASAITGGDPFKQKIDNIATIASLYPSQLQFVVTKKLGVNSIDEIISKKLPIKVSVDAPGSTGELAFRRMINEYGITYDDIKKWGGQVIFKNMGDSSDMLSDGFLDGFSTMTLAPASPIQEASVNKDLVMLPIKEEVINKLVEKYGYGKGEVPAKTYKFNDSAIPTITSYTVVIVPKDAPEELAYNISLSINENLEYLKTVHVALKELTPDKLVENLGAPLHKGAEKYYREIGVLK